MVKMKKFKKIVAAMMIVSMMVVSSAGTVSVTADNYDRCDVDRNGLVQTLDIVYVNKYLSGVNAYTNYNQLDTNGSLTVDIEDYNCVMANFLGSSYSWNYFSRATGNVVANPTISGFIPNSTASSTAGRQYRRYSYINNQELTPYTLTPTIGTLGSGVNSREVIGEDNRYPSYSEENSGIVRLGIGVTGFIVDDHHIATAAHCVYNKSINSWFSPNSIKTYDSNGNLTNTTLTPVEAHIPSYFASSNNDTAYDYALITVAEDLSEYMHFELGTSYNATAAGFEGVPIYVTGSPSDLSNSNNSYRLYSAEGNVMDKSPLNNNVDDCTDVLYYDIDTAGGQSGSPVYTINKRNNSYVYTAIAIHCAGVANCQNWGSMITNYHLQFYKNNPNVSYTIN